MRAFTIALVGAPDTGQAQLLEALNDSLKLRGWPVSVVIASPDTSTRHDLTMLMGLNALLPSEVASDQSIRLALSQTGTAYEVLYGTRQERLAQALQMVEKRLVKPSTASIPSQVQAELARKPWVWICDKCSDSQCEHQLLTQLLARRATAPQGLVAADDQAV